MKLSMEGVGAACLVFLFVACGTAEAQSSPVNFRVGPEAVFFSYDEPGVMKEEGSLVGLSGALEFGRVNDPVVFGVFGSVVAGDLDYDGSIINYEDGTEEPITFVTPNFIVNGRGVVFFRVADSGLAWSLFSGFGARFLRDDLASASEEYGYRRDQTYLYLPAGIRAATMSGSGWGLDWQLEYDQLLLGWNRSYGGVLGDEGLNFLQYTGFGFRTSLAVTFPLSGSIGFRVEPFYEYWDIDDSEIEEGFMEPKNNSYSAGVRFHLQFF